MENPPPSFVISFSIVAILTLASFASCMAAEFNRAKKKDLKLNGTFCFLPESEAFKLGVAGLVCLVMAQIVGSTIICHSYWPKENRKSCSVKRPLLSTTLLISWSRWSLEGERRLKKNAKRTWPALRWFGFLASFGIAVVMMGGATSMSRRQEYGKGWVEGECYVVKDGIFVGAALLVLINGGSTMGSAAIGKRTHVKGPNQIHAQIG